MNSLASKQRISFDIHRLRELPPLAQEEQLIFRLLQDDDVDIPDVVAAIECCPGIAARIVGLARSAYFAQRNPCNTVFDAIVRVLGLKMVRNLVIGVISSQRFSTERCRGFDSQQYWTSALLTATCARMTAPILGVKDNPPPDDAYLCGLLHNIGVLVLAHVAPREMSRVFNMSYANRKQTLTELEAQVFGFTHGEAGAWLVAQWGLPTSVCVVLEHLGTPSYDGAFWSYHSLVTMSKQVADAYLEYRDSEGVDSESLGKLKIPQQKFDNVMESFGTQVEQVVDLSDTFRCCVAAR
ncbi:MAG: HDOD domain-containing protein [Gammaproteobacteria bacterium]|nr:HDOD domain-containing protein [Gammaproteobacteria bacterium]